MLDFVIDDHRSRRRHLDLSVLGPSGWVNWALPDGVPVPGEGLMRAVRIEEFMSVRRLRSPASGGPHPPWRAWDRGRLTVHACLPHRRLLATLHGSPAGRLGGDHTIELVRAPWPRSAEDEWSIRGIA